MSGPGRATTKRDQRRMTRREQFEQRRQTRERERQRKLRNQRIQRYSLYSLAGVAAVVVIVLLSVFVFHIGSGSGSPTTKHTTPTAIATFPPVSGAAANAQKIDGMVCAATQGSAQNAHVYLEMYINGQQVAVPAGIGAPSGKNCTYPLVTPTGEPNVIHVMSASTGAYTLGQFFDVWGQPLSASQVGTYKASSSHKLVFEVFDATGKLTTITSDPRAITLVNHETLVILYNSPSAHPKAYTNWSSLKS